MKRSFLFTGIALATGLSGTAFAQNNAPPPSTGGDHSVHAHAPRTRAEVEARVRERFTALDTNKDGFLTPDELRASAPSAASRQKMRDHLFAMMDKNGDGQISKSEFDAFHGDRRPWGRDDGKPRDRAEGASADNMARGPEHSMRHRHGMMAGMMFRHADADHDGKISLAEAERAALDRFDKIDTNHDGVISDAEREAAHQQAAAHFRERRTHWMEHGKNMSPAPKTLPPPQG